MTTLPATEQTSTIELAKKLISIESVSPDQSSVQSLLIERLTKLGFTIQKEELNGSKNFWARRGTQAPLFVFSGHTDVVAAGELAQWVSPPFCATEREEKLFGRGAADMKGPVAAMITAVEAFANGYSDEWPFSVGFLITGDEEMGGASAKEFLDLLRKQNQTIDYCLVGEPTSGRNFGDTIKIGRRGSLSGTIEFHGTQGHVAYPQRAVNALHKCLAPLAALSSETWDDGNEHFQPTTFQITNLNSGIADNVVPGVAVAKFNFRFATSSTPDSLISKIKEILSSFGGVSYKLSSTLAAEPFVCAVGTLATHTRDAIKAVLGVDTSFSTTGGTSDARFFAKHGIEVLEFGPCNATIHQINENTPVFNLEELSRIYAEILRLLASKL